MIRQVAFTYLLLLSSFSPLFHQINKNTPREMAFETHQSVPEEKPVLNNDSKEFFTHPKIKTVDHKGYLVWLEDPRLMCKVKNLFGKKTDTLYNFDYMPLLFIEERLGKIKSQLREYKSTVSIFPNQIHEIPKDTPSINSRSLANPQPSVKRINASYLWKKGYTGKDVKIAIVDTGISNHKALKGQISQEKSFVKKRYGYDQNIDNTKDEIGHGTAVAGIVAGKEGRGVAPGSNLLNAKVFPDRSAGATDAGIIAAIEWSVKSGAEVINLSFGRTPFKKDPLEVLVNKVTEKGTIVTVAAGNEGDWSGMNTMSIQSPGTARNAITIGASGAGESVATFTSRGPSPNMAIKPDVTAPGVNIKVLKGTKGTVFGSGTSFAAPHVAGATALLIDSLKKSINGSLPGTIKSSLITTAEPFWNDELAEGGGEINIGRAFHLIQQSLSDRTLNVSILPQKLPVNAPLKSLATSAGFPFFQKLYIGSTHVFNFSICTGQKTNITVTLSGNISKVIKINSPSTSIITDQPTKYWEMNFSVQEGSLGVYKGAIQFQWDPNASIKIPMIFTLASPTGRMLFDVKHTSWTFSYKYGQYHRFYRLADKRNISVRQYFSDSPQLSFSFLHNFQLIFMPDTLSYGLNGLSNTGITTKEKNLLYNFTKQGGLVIFISMNPGKKIRENSRKEVNGFLKRYKIKLGHKIVGAETEEGGAAPINARVKENTIFGVNSPDSLPFWGTNLVSLDWKSTPIIKASTEVYDLTLATFRRMRKGGIFITGSNFFFDNWAFKGEYSHRQDIRDFTLKLFSWAIVRKTFQRNYTPCNFTKGERRNFSFSYTGRDEIENIETYILDAIGTRKVKIKRTDSNFSGKFPMRNGRKNDILLSASFGQWVLGRRLNFSVSPNETKRPTVANIIPKNHTRKEFEFRTDLSSFEIQVTVRDRESGILKGGLKIRVRNENGTGYQHTLSTKEVNATTSQIKVIIPKQALLDQFKNWEKNQEEFLTTSFLIADRNLNSVKITLKLVIKQEANVSRWMIIMSLIISVLVITLGTYILTKKKQKEKKWEDKKGKIIE